MLDWICSTCGVQYPRAPEKPSKCLICEDARQWVPPSGQAWTSVQELQASHRNSWKAEEPSVFSVKTEPGFAIGQQAFLLRFPEGNVLWDCVSLIDAATVDIVKGLGGLKAIAISHPHYYSTMLEWSRAFGHVPVWIHESDRGWVQRTDGNVQFWAGETFDLQKGLKLVRCGGHFDGYQVLHWDQGALFVGDQPQVTPDKKWVTFLWSYPNMVPLGAEPVKGILRALEPLQYNRIYGAFGRHVLSDARSVVRRSAERYLGFIG
jgi:hypothetical protein